jgi:LmbE family N-acetylglucosaminyl deacetylase
MERRRFLGETLAGAAALGSGYRVDPGNSVNLGYTARSDAADPPEDLVVERALSGKPHRGKVLAAIQPHADDIPLFAGGTVAKLIREGYVGYLINITNDDHAGPGTVGDTVVANEIDNHEVAKALGLSKVFILGYPNHVMEDIDVVELKARLIFLFRVLKVDTVIGYDPWGHYEENPDHYVTAQAVEAACWMSGGGKDYPEHFKAGIKPHPVREKYYHARGPQLVNRVVDISSDVDKKVESNMANKAQGPAGDTGAQLRERLARENKRLPILGNDDRTANYQYIKEFLLENDRALGKRHGLEYAEAFHYIGPGPAANRINQYVEKNAVPLR